MNEGHVGAVRADLRIDDGSWVSDGANRFLVHIHRIRSAVYCECSGRSGAVDRVRSDSGGDFPQALASGAFSGRQFTVGSP